MSRPKLFVGRSDRLIARVKMMLYAWRFIDEVGGQLFVLWPKLPERYADEDVDYSPHLIFDTIKYYAEGGSERIQFIEVDKPPPADAVDLGAPEFEQEAKTGFKRAMFAGGGTFKFRGSAHFFFDDEPADPDHRLAGVRRLFRELPVDPAIVAARDAFYQRMKMAPGEFSALHVRRGDVFGMLRNELPGGYGNKLTSKRLDMVVGHYVARSAPFEFYEEPVAAAIAAGKRILFTSDSPETIEWFQATFGRRHFVDLSRARIPITIRKAFLDFLILCDAAEIIGTSSNFSALPAELGGVPLTNVVVSGEYEVSRRVFVEQFLDRDGIDDVTRQEALDRLALAYDDLKNRKAASVRARSLKAAPADAG